MNDQKTKFYKRWWFVLIVGIILGAGGLLTVAFFNTYPQYISPSYWTTRLSRSAPSANCFIDKQNGETHCVSKEALPVGSTAPLYFELREPDGKGNFVPTGLDSKYLAAVDVSVNPSVGAPSITLYFNDEGGRLLETITARNIGKQVGFFVNGKQSFPAPTVTQAIKGGTVSIAGNMSVDLMTAIAKGLNAGKGLIQSPQ